MTASPTLFLGLWTLWGLVWLIAARRTARTVTAQAPRSRLLQLGLIGLGATLVFVHFNTPPVLAHRLVPPSPALTWGALSLTALGVTVAVWARICLGRLWSGTVTLKENHALIRTGPYSVTRHPIYTGLLTALLGTALVNGTLPAALGFGLAACGCLLKIRLEERVLHDHFGPLYTAYRANVRALIPYVW
jgi:protein-S-isoprenylcysteine O-methyltransferase Ste14